MRWILRAVLTAALLRLALPEAVAETNTQWLIDTGTRCAIFDGNAKPSDSLIWSGGCIDGLANGRGTAVFSHDGAVFERITASFANVRIQDGSIVVYWEPGWSYEVDSVNGRFNGAGVLINSANDRFEGNWIDGKMNGQGVVVRASGERYDGIWKDDLPNGPGILRRADGATFRGNFIDGKLATDSDAAPTDVEVVAKPAETEVADADAASHAHQSPLAQHSPPSASASTTSGKLPTLEIASVRPSIVHTVDGRAGDCRIGGNGGDFYLAGCRTAQRLPLPESC